MATARGLLNEALREPMREVGWVSKAAGWFVRSVTPDCLAVLSVSVATNHAPPGEGQATGHLGLRLEGVEETVARLLVYKDEGYRSRTATTPLGYATQENRWLEWAVTQADAEQRARDIAAVVDGEGWPYLRTLAEDPDSLVAAVRASPAFGQSIGFARLVVLLAHLGRLAEAQHAVEERQQQVESRPDAAAREQQAAAGVLLAWLEASG